MNPPNPPAPEPVKPEMSQVRPSDSTGTLPPAWAVKAAERIVPPQSVFDTEYREHAVARVAAVIINCCPHVAEWASKAAAEVNDAIMKEIAGDPPRDLAAIIAKHAPPPVPVSPPTPAAMLVADFCCDAFWRNTAWVASKELKLELAEIISKYRAPAPYAVPVSPPCKEREELVARLKEKYRRDCIEGAFMPEALTDAITFISGAAAVARKE